jgi:HNH endonuclease
MRYDSESQSRRARKRWATPFAERFWARVDRTGDCWLWNGAMDGQGRYGVTRDQRGKMTTAHRVAWELQFGPIPVGKEVLHSCDVKRCMRHLFLGTQQDNIDDMIAKGRQAIGEDLNHRPQDGENNHNAKVSREDVTSIRRLFSEGKRQSELAAMFNTTRANIWCIVHRKSRSTE